MVLRVARCRSDLELVTGWTRCMVSRCWKGDGHTEGSKHCCLPWGPAGKATEDGVQLGVLCLQKEGTQLEGEQRRATGMSRGLENEPCKGRRNWSC